MAQALTKGSEPYRTPRLADQLGSVATADALQLAGRLASVRSIYGSDHRLAAELEDALDTLLGRL